MDQLPGFLVCAERCNQCLFTKNKIVSDARRKEILRELNQRGNEKFFECHKHSLAGRHVCCRSDYDRDDERTQMMQVAKRLGLVVFVDEDGQLAEKTP